MGGKQRDYKQGGYKGVEAQALEKEINDLTNGDIPPNPVTPMQRAPNPYSVVGSARISKSGQSLSIKLRGEPARYLTVLLQDIFDMVESKQQNHVYLSVASVREYENDIVKQES
jgi:hypothetical protein